MTEPSFDTLAQRCKAAGVTLLRSMDDKGQACFLVGRWGLFKELPTLQAVLGWLDWTHPEKARGAET